MGTCGSSEVPSRHARSYSMHRSLPAARMVRQDTWNRANACTCGNPVSFSRLPLANEAVPGQADTCTRFYVAVSRGLSIFLASSPPVCSAIRPHFI